MIVFRNEVRGIARRSLPALSAKWRQRSLAKTGFTLIEVLLALSIVGLVLTPILMLQSMLIKNTNKRAQLIDRIYAAKKFLIDSEVALAPDANESSADKKISNPPTIMRFELKNVSSNSSLKKFKSIKQASVISSWVEPGAKRQERIVTFLFRPEGKTT